MKTLLFSLILLISATANARMFSRKAVVIDVERKFRLGQKWTTIADTEEESIYELLKILKRSGTGKKLLKKAKLKAKSQGQTLSEVFVVGRGSLTDTTLIRKFSPSSPDEIVYSSRSKVVINKDLSVMNAVLDLAHELTHFSFRKPFNPYVGAFALKGFVESTVEGRGGEVDAYLIECRVMKDLFPSKLGDKTNCDKVWDEHLHKFSRAKGISEFYKMGRHLSSFKEKLQDYNLSPRNFEHIQSKEALFISSAYGIPYPVAAIMEYESIMGKACQNDSKRLALLKNSFEGRSPASTNQFSLIKEKFNNRCQYFTSKK